MKIKIKRKKLLLVLAVFIIIAVFLSQRALASPLFGIGNKKLKTETVARGSIKQTVTASGEIAAEEKADLQFQASGKVVWVGVKKGDKVKKGQALASLDLREYQKTLELKLRDYSKTRWDFEQLRDDYDIGWRKLDEAGTLTDAQKRILEKSQFDLDKAVLNVELQDIALKNATLISPIDGEVTDIGNLIAGENTNVMTNPVNITVVNFSALIFQARVEEVDLAHIKPGQKAVVTLDAYPDEKFEGEVLRINRVAQKNVVGGTIIPVDIKLDTNEKFIVGLNGDVQILIEEKRDSLIVPRGAVHREDDSHFVWVVKNGKPEKQTITVGLQSAKITEITQGLQEGDKIVIGNVNGK